MALPVTCGKELAEDGEVRVPHDTPPNDLLRKCERIAQYYPDHVIWIEEL
jgi:hypothetical protein